MSRVFVYPNGQLGAEVSEDEANWRFIIFDSGEDVPTKYTELTNPDRGMWITGKNNNIVSIGGPYVYFNKIYVEIEPPSDRGNVYIMTLYDDRVIYIDYSENTMFIIDGRMKYDPKITEKIVPEQILVDDYSMRKAKIIPFSDMTLVKGVNVLWELTGSLNKTELKEITIDKSDYIIPLWKSNKWRKYANCILMTYSSLGDMISYDLINVIGRYI